MFRTLSRAISYKIPNITPMQMPCCYLNGNKPRVVECPCHMDHPCYSKEHAFCATCAISDMCPHTNPRQDGAEKECPKIREVFEEYILVA